MEAVVCHQGRDASIASSTVLASLRDSIESKHPSLLIVATFHFFVKMNKNMAFVAQPAYFN